MKKDAASKADIHSAQETIKLGKTVFMVNHIFTPDQTKQGAWLSIITRAEGLKTAKN